MGSFHHSIVEIIGDFQSAKLLCISRLSNPFSQAVDTNCTRVLSAMTYSSRNLQISRTPPPVTLSPLALGPLRINCASS